MSAAALFAVSFVFGVILSSGCLREGERYRSAGGQAKDLPGLQVSASLVYLGSPPGQRVDAAELTVMCALRSPEDGRAAQCVVGLAGLKAASWQGIAVDGEAACGKPEAVELAAVAEVIGRRPDGFLDCASRFYLVPVAEGNSESLARHLKICCYTAPGGDSATQPSQMVTWDSLLRKGTGSEDWYRGDYLVALPFVVEQGGCTRVTIVTSESHGISTDRESRNIDLALGLFHSQIGLIKNYGPVESTDTRVQIPPDLPAGTYYFTVADREFHINSGTSTKAYVKVPNPTLGIGLPANAHYRLIAAAAPVFDRPGSSGACLHILPPGAVVKVFASRETTGGRWYWAQFNVYKTGTERAGWLRADATVSITPENYRAARDVRLRQGAKYYEHCRYGQGDVTEPAEWNLPEEVLWVVERRDRMVRLRPSEAVSLAVDGDIWTLEENLVYFENS